MLGYWNKSIKKKLMLLFTVNTASALALAFLSFLIYLTFSYRATLVTEEAATAQMLAESSAPALTFEDRKAAAEILAVLRFEPRIETACLFDKQGLVFATYLRDNSVTACPQPAGRRSFHFTFRRLDVFYPVVLEREAVGELSLQVGLVEMYSALWRFIAMGVAILLTVSLFALLLSARMQRVISDPIIHLTQVAGRVSLDGNYSIRAVGHSEDETGVLILQFNSMMDQVNQRDRKLKNAQDELELRVEERTLALQKEIAEREVIQQDLMNAKLEAEESNRAKSAFLANMSHELRTPLNAILGYSEMLEEDAAAAGDDSAVADLRRIQTAGRQLLTLIGDVLDLSKIEAGRVEVILEPVQVGTMINDVASTIQPLAREQGNLFQTTADDLKSVVYVDVVKFRQCLLNLLSNACKFTEKGRISLAVTHKNDESGDWVLWSVSDTGIGIAEKDREKLFRSFSQVDSSATRRHGGTGLGLAISQRLTKLMGGWISLDTRLGEGATFTIHLPAGHQRSTGLERRLEVDGQKGALEMALGTQSERTGG